MPRWWVSMWRQLVHGVRALRDRAGTDAEIADEVRHYMDEAVRRLVAAGESEPAARRRVARELGHGGAIREQVRGYGWENVVEAGLEDVRIAIRRLRHSPGFAIVTVLTLALGIGAATAIFSVVRPVLLEPLPYPDPDRLVEITDVGSDGSRVAVAYGSYVELARRSLVLDALAVARPWQPTTTEGGDPQRLSGQRVSAEYFRALGVAPRLGRSFEPSEDRPGGPRVAVLADGLWRGRFGADDAIVGRQVTLDGAAYTVVGVMGPAFEDALAPAARIWTPLQYDAALPSFEGREWGHHLRMVGRLRPGVSVEDADAELDRIAARPVAELPRPRWASLENGLATTSLKESVTRAARPVLAAIAGAVLLVLLIAAVNAANLLLARGFRRRGEFAVRAALGAGRPRLIRQVLTESLLLAVMAGALGAGLAVLGVRALLRLSPPELPRLDAVGVDASVLGLAIGLSAVVGLVVGLVPALRASRVEARGGLQDAARRSTAGPRRLRGALVVAEVSLTLTLLVAAGLLLRSLDRLFAVDPGLDAGRVLALQVQTHGPRYADDDAVDRFFELGLEAVRAVPGVTSAAVTSQLPLSGEADVYGVSPETRMAGADGDADRDAFRYVVSPGYFDALGIPLRAGRALDATDRADGAPAVVLSESLARQLFPGRDPIGQRVHAGRTDRPRYTVVGVVGDVKQLSLASDEARAVYTTPGQWYFADRARWFVVRSDRATDALAARIREAIWSVDGGQPVVRVAPLHELVAASAAEQRLAFRVFQAFALAALVLSAIGLYGVLAGSVAERTREFGVRSALGSTRRGVVRLVVREALTLTGAGILIGAAGAALLGRALASLLFGVSPLDPTTYAAVVLAVAATALAAAALPAWRAASIDPSTAFRAE